jgi:hypothetical protein
LSNNGSAYDPDARETVKELAQMDGGFVVSGDRTVLSACRYFEATLPEHKQPLGLGSRHLAAASISASTGAIAVVVSECSIVRVYSAGVLVTEILRDLAAPALPAPPRPTLDSDDVQNLGIITETTTPTPLTWQATPIRVRSVIMSPNLANTRLTFGLDRCSATTSGTRLWSWRVFSP